MRSYPQSEFSLAKRTMSASSSALDFAAGLVSVKQASPAHALAAINIDAMPLMQALCRPGVLPVGR